MLYELLLRRKPFPAETVTTLVYQILHEDPLAAEEPSRLLPDDVRGLLRRCLAKSNQDRVPDGQTMAREARAVAARLTGGMPAPVATAPVTVNPVGPDDQHGGASASGADGATSTPPFSVPPPVVQTGTRPATAAPLRPPSPRPPRHVR